MSWQHACSRARGIPLTHRGSLPRLCSLALLLVATGTAHIAFAMSPDAVTAVALRLTPGLPASAGWGPALDATLAPAASSQRFVESLDPEPFASRHQFDATLSVVDAADDPGARGGGVDELLAATEAVSVALAAPDAVALAAPLVRLANAACDLADPFLTTARDAEEIPGARVSFSDSFDPRSFATTDSTAFDTFGLRDAGAAVAAESATLRGLLEGATLAGDAMAIDALRNQRLDAALTLARAALRQARADAAATMTARLAVTPLLIWPNPTHGSVRVSFILPAAATARLEVLDVSGRRVIERALGSRASGEQSVVLEAAGIEALHSGMYFVRIHAGATTLRGRMFRIDR